MTVDGTNSTAFRAAAEILRKAVAARVFPGAAVEVGDVAGLLWTDAIGTLTYPPLGADSRDSPIPGSRSGTPSVSQPTGASTSSPVTSGTVFDLASLTKVIATTTLTMRLLERRKLRLEDPVGSWLDEWQGADRGEVTLRDLLSHSSGLPAWRPLYERCRDRRSFQSAICRIALEYEPRKTSVYSDLGFILLGFVLERAGEVPLDQQFRALAEELAQGRWRMRYQVQTPPGSD
jgi:hypothetical protein